VGVVGGHSAALTEEGGRSPRARFLTDFYEARVSRTRSGAARNMCPLRDWPFKCSACGSREVALWLFAKRAEAGTWVDG
jgi:hypothetical protein